MKKQAVVYCPYCGNQATLVDSDTIYQRSYGMIWMCKPCDAYTGVHSNSQTYKPLGSLARADLREARKEVHRLLDPIWKRGDMKRSALYAWLAKQMRISQEKCHVAMFREMQCELAANILKDYHEQNPDANRNRTNLRSDME